MHTFVDGELLTAKQLNDNFKEINNSTNTRLNAVERDTGWGPISALGNWKSNSAISLRKTGINDIYMTAKLEALSSLSAGEFNNIATLPAEWRPTRDLTFSAALRRPGITPEYWPSAIVRIIAATGEIKANIIHSGTAIFVTASWPR